MLIFKYDREINENNWKRITSNGVKFNHKFPDIYNITEEDENICKNKVFDFQKTWNLYEPYFLQKISIIYPQKIPSRMYCYINSSPYSSFNDKRNYLSISVFTKNNRVVPDILHEINHWFFKKYYTEYCHSLGLSDSNIDKIKEFLTVINDDIFFPMQDGYWEEYAKYRALVLEVWKKTKDIKEVIRYIKDNFSNNL